MRIASAILFLLGSGIESNTYTQRPESRAYFPAFYCIHQTGCRKIHALSRLFPKGSLMKMRQSSHRECSEPRKCLSDCVLTRRKVVGIHDKKSGYIEYLSQGEMHLQEF